MERAVQVAPALQALKQRLTAPDRQARHSDQQNVGSTCCGRLQAVQRAKAVLARANGRSATAGRRQRRQGKKNVLVKEVSRA